LTVKLETAKPGKLLFAGQSLCKIDHKLERIAQNRGTKRQKRLETDSSKTEFKKLRQKALPTFMLLQKVSW